MTAHRSPPLPARITPLASAIAACLAFSAIPSQAATITVINAGDSGLGSLRQAVIDTNSGGVADTINFAAGLDGQTITLTSGQIDIDDSAALSIDASALASGITLSGDNNSRLLGVTQNQLLTLNNLTLTEGRTTADNDLTIDCASGSGFPSGGALCAEGALTLTNSTVSGNSTAGSSAWGGGFFALGTTRLTNSTVSGNRTKGDLARGGGFFTFGSTRLTNSTVSSNRTAGVRARGGGFRTSGTATLINSTVSGNSTAGSSAYGGGFSADGTTRLTNSTVSGNSTTGFGANGGGFFTYGTTRLTNSTVSGNSTAGFFANGGGFSTDREAATLTNSTLTQNNATNAMGDGVSMRILFSSITLTLNSSIVADNGSDNLNVAASAGGSVTVNANNSLFGDAAGEINGTNTANIFNNVPALAALADNGCATLAGASATAACVQTHALLPGSPALETGAANSLTTDQRGTGFPRELNGQADIGAFEVLPIEFSVANASMTEGSGGGTTTLNIPVSVNSTVTASSVQLDVTAGTATAGSDYTDPGSVIVNFAIGDPLTQNIAVSIVADNTVEADESFAVDLSTPVGASITSGSAHRHHQQ